MRILYVEPFDGGSHATFTRTLTAGIEAQFSVLRLPGRHWKWRMRGSAAWAALEHAPTLQAPHDVLFCSSYVPLAELVGLAPALSAIPRVLYFHENQLAFPARGDAHPERDDHFGFTQLVSALAADTCWFNSRHNLDSFVQAGRARLRRLPDAVPRGWIERIVERSEVWPVPVDLPDVAPEIIEPDPTERARGPVVLWNHRWEHDKNPEGFFEVLFALAAEGVPFRLAVCGRRFREVPGVFERARQRLADRIVHFGMLDDAAQVHGLLARADVVVSTAHHEFFGISMVEATHFGARPLVPDRLAYPEIFGDEYRYADDAHLTTTLRELCEAHVAGATLRADRRAVTRPYLASNLLPRYAARLRQLAGLNLG
jgi:glycosyltransferase involved in cell wall biosynthesis